MSWCGSLLLLYTCVMVSQYVSCESELPQHGGSHEPVKQRHDHDGEHNVEYDHEAVIGSRSEHEDFENMSPEEAKRRLGIFIDRMDTNHDDKIERQELIDWVYNSFKSLDAEEADEYFEDHDTDEDGQVTLQEYLERNYGYTMEEMNKWYDDLTPEIQHYAKMVTEDKEKFKVADRDESGALSREEYQGFYHPWSAEYMHDLEIERTLAEQDGNNDGFVDLHEYLGGENLDDAEDEIIEKENFMAFDENSDGKLDRDEIKKWVIPDHMETAEDEAEHLILETDVDGDGVLSRKEILDQVELWVGSAVTDYGMEIGEKFHDPQEL